MATTTWLTRLENLVPRISIPITTSAMTTAGRSMKPSEAEASAVGTSSAVPSSSDWR